MKSSVDIESVNVNAIVSLSTQIHFSLCSQGFTLPDKALKDQRIVKQNFKSLIYGLEIKRLHTVCARYVWSVPSELCTSQSLLTLLTRYSRLPPVVARVQLPSE